jgi:hypothetical protein
MTAVVEKIRQEIDSLAPNEAQELFADLQHDYAIRLVPVEETALKVEELSEADQAKIAALRQDIQLGVASLDRGEGREIDWDAFLAERHRDYAARQAS